MNRSAESYAKKMKKIRSKTNKDMRRIYANSPGKLRKYYLNIYIKEYSNKLNI